MTQHYCRTHRANFTATHCPACETDARRRHAESETHYEPFTMPDLSSSYDFGSSSSDSSSSSSYDSGSSSSSDFGGGGGFSGGGGGDSW